MPQTKAASTTRAEHEDDLVEVPRAPKKATAKRASAKKDGDRHRADRRQKLIRLDSDLDFWVTVMAAKEGISSTEFIERAVAREVQRRFDGDWNLIKESAGKIQPVLAKITAPTTEESDDPGGDDV
jgi:hypothetical protein